MKIIIKSAIKLTADQKSRLEKLLIKKYKKPSIDYVVDAQVIGGIAIQIGSRLLDVTLKSKLDKLKQQVQVS